ncbi:T9SS type A sorting domain-containing protein [Pseudotenacibaculum sp. MALMAid0570]|uniref:T9SS type A sorting domain-containing protein n=1 Tax=Pseudotenacibaculum sp. MALMAid0570 TaxID=3143938 RepID=UPI0032DF3CFE
MKKLLSLIILLLSISLYAQKIQNYAPWASKAINKNSNPTLEQIAKEAENYFKTIDENAKGSGLKPFERWKYHWSFFLDEQGRIKDSKALWDAWKEKNEKNASQNRLNDLSNWTSLGPYAHTNTASWSSGQGRVNVVTVDPNNSNTLYVGAPAGGIWKSTDAGINWSPLTDHLPQIGVSGIAIDHTNSDIIYIATGDDDANDSYAVGVWKSTDGGTTWNNTGVISPNPGSMNEIYIFPNDANTIMVATSSGVFKSIDGGATWVQKSSINARSLKMKPGDQTTWYAVSSNEFYKSTDSGETFQSVFISGLSGATRLEIDVTPANANYVYLLRAAGGSAFGGVFKSTNSGSSFTKTPETTDIFESTQAWFDMALGVSDTDENTLFVGVLNVWRSTNGGTNFSKINNWSSPNAAAYTHADIHYLRYFNGKLYAGTDGGVYVSSNDGNSFTDLTENLAIGQFYRISVAVQNSGNIVGGLQDNGGYAFSDNNWNNYYGADGMDCAVNPTNANNYFGFIQRGGVLYETTDGGQTRTGGIQSPNNGTLNGNWVTPLAMSSEGDVYAGYNELYRLENGAWAQVSNASFGGNLVNVKVSPRDPNVIFVTRGSNLYRSIDKGENFESFFVGAGTINAIDFSSIDDSFYFVTNSGVYKVPNAIAPAWQFTWQSIGTSTPSESKLSIKHHARSGNNTLYLGTSLGVYSMNDDDTEWQTFDNNLPNVAIRDLEINEEDSKLIAATYGRGVFVSEIPRQLPPVDVKIVSINNPTDGINCNSTFTPQITIKNQGVNVLTDVTVNYNFDNGTGLNYNWNGSLNSEETSLISLPQITISDLGVHTINVEVTATNDTYDTNNTLSEGFKINDASSNPTIVNSFENATTDALLSENAGSTSNSLWEIATPSKTLLNSAGTGSQAYVTGASGNYPNNTTSYLYSNCYDLTQVVNPVLSFKMAFDIEENWDYLVVEYSTNSGDSWQILGSANDPNWYNSSSTANGIPGRQWTGEGEDTNSLGGNNATVHDYSYDLGSFSSESNIIFRFKFAADSGVNEEGVMIDDFVINGTLSVINEEFSNIVSVFPNPSNNLFNVKWSNNEKTTISVYNYLGQKVFEQKDIMSGSYPLYLNNQSKGLYILKINSNGKIATKKIILE